MKQIKLQGTLTIFPSSSYPTAYFSVARKGNRIPKTRITASRDEYVDIGADGDLLGIEFRGADVWDAVLKLPPSLYDRICSILKSKGIKKESYKGRFSEYFILLGMFPKLDAKARRHARVEGATHTYLTLDNSDCWSLGQAKEKPESTSMDNGNTFKGLQAILKAMK